ncbi:MAG: phosphoribosylaminoimidazolesuccinocarboxamide synthase [Chthonomonadales bacterium]|nr:phosphoribosylaminoimidazolesuccinocarboxamide synthase [Chthonomonadales bacterium]
MADTPHRTILPGIDPIVSGKVREIFPVDDALLIVVSDRISAYDSVMPTPIPNKGRILTELSRYWFRRLRPITPTHYITADMDYIATRLRETGYYLTPSDLNHLHGRSMLVVRADMLPVECVVRGYLAGSLYAEYLAADGPSKGARLHDIDLPPGLLESARLTEPVFTPATKAETGHDVNISFSQMSEIVGSKLAEELRRTSLDIYRAAADLTLQRGIIIADTKFEFGLHRGVLTLADEVLTPDSSRFWNADLYQPGHAQPSFDKQYLRDWLIGSGWDREPPAPELPEEVVRETSSRYRRALEAITGSASAITADPI